MSAAPLLTRFFANFLGRQDLTNYHLLAFLGAWLGGMFDGMDSTLMSVVLPQAIGQLAHTTDNQVIANIGSWVTAIFLVGWTAGGILFGITGDKLGRVRAMMFSILLYALFTGLAGFAQNWEQLAICRFLTGVGIGGELVTIATFLSEVWPERSRALAVGSLLTSYQAGVFLAGSINYWVPDWRLVFFLGALPALLVVFLRSTLNESEKWIEAQRRHKVNLAENAETPSHFRQVFKKHHTKNLILGGLAFGGFLVGYWASASWIPAWIQSLLSNASMSLAGNPRTLATMIQGSMAMVGCVLGGVFANIIGRRWTIIVGGLGMFGFSAWMFLSNSTFSDIIYVQCGLLGIFVGMAQAAMYIYLPELFPTLIRATAFGFCLNVGRTVTVLAVFFVGTLVAVLGGYGQAATVFAGGYLIAAGAAFFGKETKGQLLPE